MAIRAGFFLAKGDRTIRDALRGGLRQRESMSDALLRETERFLHDQIPLTRAMGVEVRSWDGRELCLAAPLEPNHNHLGTAFGGSLSALATLAGYSLVWLLLGERGAHIVIRDSSLRYLHPVRGELRATCRHPGDAAWQAFQSKFTSSGKARLTLNGVVVEEGRICVEFEGTFVALK